MSSILDALRRIEREEDGHRGSPLDLGPEGQRFGPRRRRPWATMAVAIGLAGTVGGALWLYWPDGADVEPVPQEHPDDVARSDTPPREEGVAATNPEWEASVKAARLKQRKKDLAERRKQQHAKRNPTFKKAKPLAGPSAPEQTGGTPAADAARAPVREPAGTAASLPARSDPAPTAPAPPTPALAPAPPTPVPAPPAEVALAQPVPPGEATLPWKRPFVAAQEPDDVEPTVTALAGDADADDADVAATRAPTARPSAIELPAATAEPAAVVANIAPGAGVLEPPTIAPGTADMGGMEPPSRPAEDQPTEELAAPTGRRAPPTHLSRAERLEELKEQRAIPQEDRPVAPTAPSETPPAALPEGEKVLQRLPSGAPKVRVNFLFYSREPARRRIMVTVDNGSLVTLFEGQSVDTLGVERILPNEVHFRFDGKLFAVRPRY
jgi:hypothetical protein